MDTTQYYNPDDTICALATAAGSGAIAVVRLSGTRAIAIADSIWQGKSLATAKSHTAHLGLIINPADGQVLDQAVATVFRAPGTLTGEDVVEFGIHGSRWIQSRLLDLLCVQGARMALPGEFSRRAFIAGRLDLAEAEAIADLIAADSKAAHRLAVSQLRGDFSKHIAKLRADLVDLTALLELELDFSEEEVEFASRARLIELCTTIHTELTRLADSFRTGAAIKDGIPVAIIGPTNAGKSSLLNALVGDDRAIVSPIHGTTRDIIEDTLEIGPYRLRLLDTAGLRHTDDTIEAIGIERSHLAAQKAEIVLYVTDSTVQPDQAQIADSLAGIAPDRIILIQNKTDLLSSPTPVEVYQSIPVSALTGAGLDALKAAIEAKIQTLYNTGDTDIIVTNARHAQALSAAATSAKATIEALNANIPADLVAQDLRETIHHLGSITGQISNTEILATIFSRFCIGK